jgi:hypothetical protein
VSGHRRVTGNKALLGRQTARQAAWRAAAVATPEWPVLFRRLPFLGMNAAQGVALAGYLRDIFGNPFRPVRIEPAWLSWNGGAVVGLARAAYDERTVPPGHLDAGRVGMLADALEDAGCADAAILGHLRGPAPRWRGCWVVDALLGRQ